MFQAATASQRLTSRSQDRGARAPAARPLVDSAARSQEIDRRQLTRIELVHSRAAAALLLTDDPAEADTLAAELEAANHTRRDLTTQAMSEARAAIAAIAETEAIAGLPTRLPSSSGIVTTLSGLGTSSVLRETIRMRKFARTPAKQLRKYVQRRANPITKLQPAHNFACVDEKLSTSICQRLLPCVSLSNAYSPR